MKSLNVIIPCLKEAENLKFLLPQIIENLEPIGLEYEIIIVDSCIPMDDSPQICDKFTKVKYVNTIGVDNYGSAVKTGIITATKEFTLFMDADGSHNPKLIPKIIEKINGKGICIASRYCAGGKTNDKVTSIFLSKLLNFVYSLILRTKCSDWSGSFKMYKTGLLKEIRLESENFDIIPEIVFKTTRLDNTKKIEEVPYTFDTRVHGQTKRKLKTYLDFFITLIKLRIS